jgi:hypothetical protein
MINSKFAEIIAEMNLSKRIEAFSQLGNKLGQLVDKEHKNFQELFENISNEWYTTENVLFSIKSIANNLKINALNEWVNKYPSLKNHSIVKKIGLVTAGNIPLVGFHDILCILISGNKLVLKHSSKDEKLMNWVLNSLIEIEPEFQELIQFEQGVLKDFDAIIATGSDNTAKYFEYYFGKYPHIIRKNRNSIAILTGEESNDDLKLLANDILLYFGLGCRNVSKIYIPQDFDIQRIFKNVIQFAGLIDHNKFANNYLYNKTIYMMDSAPFLENGFLILKEDFGMNSPISVVFYEKYLNINNVKARIKSDKDKIQCIVAKEGIVEGSVGFGQAQKPKLDDYADNIDTMKFLLSLE